MYPPTPHTQTSDLDDYNKLSIRLSLKNKKKSVGSKLSPIKMFVLGSSPSVNRKLLTHILTNVSTHIYLSWAIQ